jgi:hypothetical protein
MSDRQFGEKEEKEEKREEKEEKERDEKWRRDPLSVIIWAAILIWAGLVFLADNLGLLTRFEGLGAWGLVFIGAGLIVLLEVAVRLLRPEYRRSIVGTLIFGVILIAIGAGNVAGWNVVWPIALIIGGAAILLSVFLRRR